MHAYTPTEAAVASVTLGQVQEALPQAGQAFPPGQISGGDELGSQVTAGPGAGGGAGGGPGAGGGAGGGPRAGGGADPVGNHTSTSVAP